MSFSFDQTRLTLPMAMHRAADAYQHRNWHEAEQLCRSILTARPDFFEALYLLGIITAQTRRANEAAKWLRCAVAAKPADPLAQNLYGDVLKSLGRFQEAVDSYDRALKLKPDFAEAYHNRGDALIQLGRPDEALDSYERAVRVRPDYAEAYNNRGVALHALHRFAEAIDSYERALNARVGYAEAHYNRGLALNELGDSEEALRSYERALALDPRYAAAHNNRGVTLQALKRFEEARESYDRALQITPDLVEALHGRGDALQELGRFEEALESYDRALRIKPDVVEAWHGRGDALFALGRLEAARDSYEQGLRVRKDRNGLYGAWLHTKMQLCDWADLDVHIELLLAAIGEEQRWTAPFPLIAITDSVSLQLCIARTWAHAPAGAMCPPPKIAKRARHDRIRVGYYSADFHDHATAYLIAELFEQHTHERFELTAFSFGPDRRDEMRQRLSAAFDRFLDVRSRSDTDVASISRDLQIDIAVDLKGFTRHGRHGIFAGRAAPIQVNYLGYPGTMGADYMDYIVADRTVIPEASRRFYAEKVVYLPHSYQVNDRQRPIANQEFSRAELGLPPTGFIFCCFNNNYKITPDTFSCWMRILRQAAGSVLWLLADNATAADNLRREAAARGVDAGRLIFGRRMPMALHLARHRAADLFIDTLPCGAHTTASDALWAGLPVLAQVGGSFASRVAASLLKALDLPDLITTTQEEYERLAVSLAADPDRLQEIKQRLGRNRPTSPLFDTEVYARDLECAYTQMYERYHTDSAPDHIVVQHPRREC
jgi:protein O-GlcNAc transferase